MKSWHCPVALSPDTQMSHWWQLSLLSDRTCAPWFGWDDNSILHGWLHTSCSREHQICCGAHGGEGGEGECDRVTADWISSMYFILSLPPPPLFFFFLMLNDKWEQGVLKWGLHDVAKMFITKESSLHWDYRALLPWLWLLILQMQSASCSEKSFADIQSSCLSK